jgi:CheY-like chemotaxis protein
MNLCLNARDAMTGGGQLTFELANRTVATGEARPPRRAGDFVRISVCDTGAGMTPEELARLLEANDATSGAGEAARLVLSVARAVVRAQGGWMEAESEPGRGSRFHVFLPRAVSSTVARGTTVVPGVGAGPGLEGKETILVVDDEQTVRAVLEAMLVFRGYKVLEAGDGVEAIERLRTGREAIDLVLLDIQMPRLNGWEAMGRIHALRPKLPVLLLSGGNSDPPGGDEALARSAGVVGKPFASADLLRAVRQALDATPKQG